MGKEFPVDEAGFEPKRIRKWLEINYLKAGRGRTRKGLHLKLEGAYKTNRGGSWASCRNDLLFCRFWVVLRSLLSTHVFMKVRCFFDRENGQGTYARILRSAYAY